MRILPLRGAEYIIKHIITTLMLYVGLKFHIDILCGLAMPVSTNLRSGILTSQFTMVMGGGHFGLNVRYI